MYKKLKRSHTVLLAALLAGGAQQVFAADENSFKATYEAAEAARKEAASVGFEWRDTKKMLKKAKEVAAGGDYDKAEKMAMKAKLQGELGVKQAAEQATAWQSAVVR